MATPASEALIPQHTLSIPLWGPVQVPRAMERTQDVASRTIVTVFPPGSPQKYVATCVAPALAFTATFVTVFFVVGFVFWKTVSRGQFRHEDFGNLPTVAICTVTGMFITVPTVLAANEIYESYNSWKKNELNPDKPH